MKIFLGDLVHDWEKVSLWTVPLNVGYIGAYAQKHFPSELEVRLFKSPEKMIAAIKKEKPDVVGLSYYVWNANLNNAVFSRTREYVPHALTVGGGPSFTSANATEDQGGAFFTKVPACDAFILNQGERGFVNLIARYRAVDGNRERLAAEPIPGVMINGLAHQTGILIDLDIEVIKDLDAIPSPYQNGMMDEFLAEPFVPLLETNRSCPYRCTFCAWGIGTGKLSRFSTERVFADIDYIGAQKPASANIFIVDANFSILERDVEIAQHLFQSHEKYGFPGHVGCQWNKSRPDRVMRVARELRGLSEVGASMQSLDSDVLDAIKRRNLQLEDVANMIGTLRSEGIETSFSQS